MIHKNKEQFLESLNLAVNRTGFRPHLLEKDYYLTLILSQINALSDQLVFKGGTCLNKIYYAYYRLSEDLDFSMQLPDYTVTRGVRRKSIQPVKDNIEKFAKQFGMRVDGIEEAGRNVSKQYVYYFVYRSALQPSKQPIKFEISLRFNPMTETVQKPVKHVFNHPFTEEPLFDGGEVKCLSLYELIAEKLRVAATRKTIAPRDFYDLDFVLRNKFNLASGDVMDLFKKKLAEDKADLDLSKYKSNLGRSESEIAEMKSRIEVELFDVLTVAEREQFDLDQALKRINKAMAEVENSGDIILNSR